MKISEYLSIDEYKETLYKLIKLKIWFVWNTKITTNESIEYILNKRVDIYRQTYLIENQNYFNPDFSNKEWTKILNKIQDIYLKCSMSNDFEKFEKQSFDYLKPYIENKLEIRYNQNNPELQGYDLGCLKYDKLSDDTKDTICVHIGNILVPKSIFDEKDYIPRCFVRIMDDAEKKYGARFLTIDSWLNSYDKWLKIFPDEWLKNIEEPNENIKWHLGFWGQFINSKGQFNKKLANQFINNKRIPFPKRFSKCSFESMRNHIKENYNV